MKASSILTHADKLLNHTLNHRYENPVDIATVIDLLAILIKTQVNVFPSLHFLNTLSI